MIILTILVKMTKNGLYGHKARPKMIILIKNNLKIPKNPQKVGQNP